jgi:hypothetical protein
MMRPNVPVPTGTEIGAPVFFHLHTTTQAVGRSQGNRAHDTIAELLLYFKGQARFGIACGCLIECQRLIDLGHGFTGEFDVDNRANTLNDVSVAHGYFLNVIQVDSL